MPTTAVDIVLRPQMHPARSPRASDHPSQALLMAAVLAALTLRAPAQQLFEELTQRLPSSGEATQCIALGDVDGDGDVDLVCAHTPRSNGYGPVGGQNDLYLNDGRGGFHDGAARMPSAVDRTYAVTLGDVDGDGDLDLLVGNYGQDRLYLNDGTGTFADATATQMPADNGFTGAMLLGDVDGDGDLDLLKTGGAQRLLLNNGHGAFTAASAAQMPTDTVGTSAIALGDIDGDGDLDLVCGRRGPERLLLNDGSGTFTEASFGRLPIVLDDTTCMALGDVDGDGDLDLLVGNMFQQDRLYRNDGTGTFTDVTAAQMPIDTGSTAALAFGDLDGDGDLDLAIGDVGIYLPGADGSTFHGEQNRVYLNDGSGTFADATSVHMPVARDRTLALVLGDIDGDGDIDLVTGNAQSYYASAQDRLYLNLVRQIDAPAMPTIGQGYRLDVYARSGPARLFDVALTYVGTAAANLPLPPLGVVGVDPRRATFLPPLLVPQPLGRGSVTITVPNDQTLVGLEVFAQALLVQYPVQVRLTGVAFGVVQ